MRETGFALGRVATRGAQRLPGEVESSALERIHAGIRKAVPTGFASHDRATLAMQRTLDGLVAEHKPTLGRLSKGPTTKERDGRCQKQGATKRRFKYLIAKRAGG